MAASLPTRCAMHSSFAAAGGPQACARRFAAPALVPAAAAAAPAPSTSGRTAACAGAPRRQAAAARRMPPAAALRDEEAELDRITREAGQADLWDNEFVGIALKLALVAGLAAVAVFIGRLGEPLVDNTIKSFPSPAEYENYEARQYDF